MADPDGPTRSLFRRSRWHWWRRSTGRRDADSPASAEEKRGAAEVFPPLPEDGRGPKPPPRCPRDQPAVVLSFLSASATLSGHESPATISCADPDTARIIASIRRRLGGQLPADGGEWGAASTTGRVGQILRAWAGRHGRIIDPAEFAARLARSSGLVGGNEHHVFRDRETGRVVKMTKPGKYGAGGVEAWLHNIERANAVFGDDIQLIGVLEVVPGDVQLVISQPFICGRNPTVSEITRLLADAGYRQVTGRSFYHSDRRELISDAQEKNFIKHTESGTVFPIDVHFLTPSDGRAQMFDDIIDSGNYPQPVR